MARNPVELLMFGLGLILCTLAATRAAYALIAAQSPNATPPPRSAKE
jgi:hypothetical protein